MQELENEEIALSESEGDFITDQGEEIAPQITLDTLKAELDSERRLRQMSENRMLCIELLEEHSLPKELGEYLTCDSVEETQKRVKEVARIFKKAINDEVKGRLATINTPNQGKTAMTKAQFRALSLPDRQRLYLTDKELYKELSKN